ncbi:hypothetical protein, partial [Shimia haliotis]|uniref:hypothetical protein n=1 Tax=Shimia haliotis TaxID=1280847 RepID=UPI001BAF540F
PQALFPTFSHFFRKTQKIKQYQRTTSAQFPQIQNQTLEIPVNFWRKHRKGAFSTEIPTC